MPEDIRSRHVAQRRVRSPTEPGDACEATVYGSLRVGVRPTSLGAVLLALSPHGVAGLFPGDDEDALQRELRRRFRFEKIEEPDVDYARTADAVLALLDGVPAAIPIPLDLRGTPFQLRVWRALTGIPAGATVAYGDVARTIGAPGAARAVAGACAANPVAVLVPCHRVVRADGDLSGYRWGAARKSMLLARERSTPKDRSNDKATRIWPE